MTEQELILGCIRQESLYQKQLFNMFAGRFMTICLRYANNKQDAEDMLQEGFLNIFKNIKSFRYEGAFEGWLCKIVVHSCLHFLRTKNTHIVHSNDEQIMDVPASESYSYDTITETELLKLINALPSGYRTVFNLYVIEGYSHEEIAKLLNIQAATSRTQLVKARRLLQQQIIELQKIAV